MPAGSHLLFIKNKFTIIFIVVFNNSIHCFTLIIIYLFAIRIFDFSHVDMMETENSSSRVRIEGFVGI